MRNFTPKKKILFGTIITAILLIAAVVPILIPKGKHLIAVSQIEHEQRKFLGEITKDARNGKMINSPFKIGGAATTITKKWGKPYTFDLNKSEISPFYMDALTNGMYPDNIRSFIYKDKNVKFQFDSNMKIKSITSVDPRLNKLSKATLTKYYGKPVHELSDYSLYKVGDYQLMFQFLHDEEFFNTNRYIILPKDSSEDIKTISQIAKLAKQGKVLNFSFPIGTSTKVITQELRKPNQNDSGGSSYIYENASLEVDLKKHQTVGMIANSKKINNISYITLKNTLGKPLKEEIDETRLVTYKYGKYQIHFFFTDDVPGNSEITFYSID